MVTIDTAWNYQLVVLSVVIAMIGSYVAMDFASRIQCALPRSRKWWFLAGALTMGLAIWSMHFVGMLALILPIPVTYDSGLSALSIFAAVAFSGIAFALMNRPQMGLLPFLFGSLAMGLAIVSMHYIGMASMQMDARIRYDLIHFAISIVIAIAVSAVALWLAYRLEQKPPRKPSHYFNQKIFSSVVMGVAISGMHYTGMSAAEYIPVEAGLMGDPLPPTVGRFMLFDLLVLGSALFGTTLLMLTAQLYVEKQQALSSLKKALNKLQESQSMYRRIVETSYEGIWWADASGKTFFCNKRLANMLGYSVDEMMQLNIFEVVDPVDHAFLVENLKRRCEGVEEQMEIRYRHKDGHSLWVNISASPVFDPENQYMGSFAMITDISDRKRAEQNLKNHALQQESIALLGQKALKGLELSELFQEAVDLLAKTLGVNYAKLVKYIPELPGISFLAVHGWDPTLIGVVFDRNAEPHSLYTLQVNQPVIVFDIETETRFSASYLHKQHGLRSGISVIIMGKFIPFGVLEADSSVSEQFDEDDIHYLNSMASILAMAIERKEDEAAIIYANRKKSQFLANMSHELRTPLNAIIGYSEMLENGMAQNDKEKQARYLRNISSSGHHLLAMVNDILDLSKVEAGKIALVNEWVRLEPLIFKLESLNRTLAEERNIQIDFEIEEGLERVFADPTRLKQIFFNLISNAIKFNREGGSVHVHIRPSEDGRTLISSVQDTGIGIPENRMGELFSEFYQVNTASSPGQSGTGLGLALTKKLVEVHGGTLSVKSEEGVGSTFTFTLPTQIEMRNRTTGVERNGGVPLEG